MLVNTFVYPDGTYRGLSSNIPTQSSADKTMSPLIKRSKGSDVLIRTRKNRGRFVFFYERPLSLRLEKHSLQYTGRSPLGLKGTSHSFLHSAHVALCISRGYPPPLPPCPKAMTPPCLRYAGLFVIENDAFFFCLACDAGSHGRHRNVLALVLMRDRAYLYVLRNTPCNTPDGHRWA